MLANEIPVPTIGLLNKAKEMLDDGYRFVTATTIQTDTGFDILYHFDKNYELVNFRLSIGPDEVVPSISGVYFAAVIIENEIKDNYGIDFSGLPLDFGGRLMLGEDSPKAPFVKPAAAAKGEKGGESDG